MKIDRLYELFDQAVELENSEQLESFLAEHCGDDFNQRQELKGLLKAHERGHRLLDSPTQAMDLNVVSPTETEGDLVGHYKLLQKIGEGGMGIVFMAEQMQPIRRKIAMKIIREGLNSKQILARFEAEREALSRLEHPNATRILDAGVTNTGRPFFVMDLVRGTHITHYCNTQRLTVNQRLELMEKVCMVIHHAHQKGILHRDIKPSNVMITLHDGVPVPKVIDFGIAKALDRPLTEQTLFTRYGDLVGTPEYMSPEQAEMSGLDLDVRTDIYSLGVLLYELLTGSTPLTSEQIKGRGLLKIFETIRDSEAERPSLRITKTISASETIADERLSTPKLLRKSLVGDLDWITMKALSKDRNERYDSAAAMAKDIRNYLQGEPVEAAAPSLAYRLRKFYRKHKSISIVASASTLLLLVSTALSIYWAIVSAKNERIARDKSIQLEDKSVALENALTRALDAEKKAEALARAESRRATEASARVAMVRHLAKQTEAELREYMLSEKQGVEPNSEESLQATMIGTRLDMMFSVLAPVSNLPLELQAGQQSVVGPTTVGDTLTMVPAVPLPSTAVFRTGEPIVDQIGIIPQDEGSTVSAVPSSGLVIRVDNSNQKPPIYYDFLLEEQRRTFGNRDVIVAETLYQRALSRITQVRMFKKLMSENDERNSKVIVQVMGAGAIDLSRESFAKKPDWVANENDLREAMAILTDKPDVDLQRFETAALLSLVLSAQNKNTQATELRTLAGDLINRLSSQSHSEADTSRIKLAQEHLSEKTEMEE
jgi:serine/threonine protein kinase